MYRFRQFFVSVATQGSIPSTNTKLKSLVCSGQYPLSDFMICQHILYSASTKSCPSSYKLCIKANQVVSASSALRVVESRISVMVGREGGCFYSLPFSVLCKTRYRRTGFG